MKHVPSLIATLLVFTFTTIALAQPNVPKVKKETLGKTRNVHSCGNLFLAGQPPKEDLQSLKRRGIKRIITLRGDDELNWDEGAAAKEAGLELISLPIDGPDAMTDELFERVRGLLRDSQKTPTLLHCGSANRVGAVWLAHRVIDQGIPLATAIEEAKQIGLRSPALEKQAVKYVKRQTAEKSVRPGINSNFLKSDLNVSEWLGRFEVESREVFGARRQVLKAAGIQAGHRVADIGAGTGFFTRMFSEAVGEKGWVYAVDISPRFLEHIRKQAKNDGLENITTVLSSERAVSLPPDSVDVVFICDTYHHFEYPKATLASIHRALKPGGTLIVIDFERIPGKSREFIVNHVRAGKDVFRSEIEAAGFVLEGEKPIEGFRENYFLLLKKRNEKTKD